MHKALNLPAVPSALKAIAPYLQRADELYRKEPIVAYWCLYYATQTGIAAKVTRDVAARDFLSQLIGTLERLKAEIGPNDAVDLEAASAAYVENFALKVFTAADNEDRKGGSTRATAKKFLAAANFLEVLKTFPQTEISEPVEDKVRYAKWKAAEIAKAFREGRKPTPGPAGGEAQPSPELELPSAPPLETTPTNTSFSSGSTLTAEPSASSSSPKPSSPKRYSPPAIKRPSPPPILDDLPLPPQLTHPRAHFGLGDPSDLSSGNWSTAATPGNTTVSGTPLEDVSNTGSPLTSFPALGQSWDHQQLSTSDQAPSPKHARSGTNDSNTTENGRGASGRPRRDSSSPKRVHFESSRPQDSNRASSPPASFDPALLGYPSAPAPHSEIHHAHPNSHLSFQPVLPPPPSAPTFVHHNPPPPPPQVPAPAIPAPEVELTPAVIAKAQKHCRFAISSLDYEDAAQARKELRAALATLGG
ncbi:hypothetical protein E1B28_001447 [Marasmius oreades]|uniref:DUF605-domain-containing protein n=1 Tax=Marasmius oreades TaxID=181124 RepID=A0A9P7V3L4_9AGAR|nr:uncharacterized protein E1B28_001447 [Marasmius oreades]KAG7099619.1 hypothetical protein E1B28_001447 [Marasmius oreades]